MGRPAASAKETAPELRLTMTCSLAVVRTKDAGRSASFQPVVREGLGRTSSEARLKKPAERAKATRTTDVGEELDAEIAGVEVEDEAVGLAVHASRALRERLASPGLHEE